MWLSLLVLTDLTCWTPPSSDLVDLTGKSTSPLQTSREGESSEMVDCHDGHGVVDFLLILRVSVC